MDDMDTLYIIQVCPPMMAALTKAAADTPGVRALASPRQPPDMTQFHLTGGRVAVKRFARKVLMMDWTHFRLDRRD